MWSLNHVPEFDDYGASIGELAHQPLRITVRTDTAVSCNDPIALDGVLAYAMVTDALKGRPFPQGEGPFWQPLPLECIRRIHGLPLWASTDFIPSHLTKSLTHIHRRTADNPYAMPGLIRTLDQKRPRRYPSSSAGPYMDYRVPERRFVAESWSATCTGNADEIRRLLALVQHFGKGGKRGQGVVRSWDVEVIHDFSFYLPDGRPLRPIPITDPGWSAGSRQGWTPPYWLRETWMPCIPSSVATIL